MEDTKINVKVKLSALWCALMFFYAYTDILGFYAPGHISELITGEIAGIQITPVFLLSSAILMAIPSLMVFLSLTLKAKINRPTNIIIGIALSIVLLATFFTGDNPAYYILYGTIEELLLVLIILHAWKWNM
ncbi:MAG: DUF6326 family protein [Candidatus Thorarchaeota archaeon]